MIELFAEKKDCCGCGACMNICPKTAIHMEKDEYGFVYPKIDTENVSSAVPVKRYVHFKMNQPENSHREYMRLQVRIMTL